MPWSGARGLVFRDRTPGLPLFRLSGLPGKFLLLRLRPGRRLPAGLHHPSGGVQLRLDPLLPSVAVSVSWTCSCWREPPWRLVATWSVTIARGAKCGWRGGRGCQVPGSPVFTPTALTTRSLLWPGGLWLLCHVPWMHHLGVGCCGSFGTCGASQGASGDQDGATWKRRNLIVVLCVVDTSRRNAL